MMMMMRMMKVTVYFDEVGVLVPCYGQDLTVNELAKLAVARYKKAIGKPNEYLVIVHKLKTTSGGILDGDDRVLDVVDDREQVFASYEEEGDGGGMVRANRGDGTSASSIGTNSPDLSNKRIHLITDAKMLRQASEPALTVGCSSINGIKETHLDDSFEANVSVSQDDTILSMKKFDQGPKRKYGSVENPQKVVSSLPPLGFVRNLSIRKSVYNKSSKNNTVEWVENQQLNKVPLIINNKDATRSDPVGSNSSSITASLSFEGKSKLVELHNDDTSLGIHVTPDYDPNGRCNGLLVHSVDAAGKVGRDGRVREMDRIIEINGRALSNVDFVTAQDILKEAMKSTKLTLRIVPYLHSTTTTPTTNITKASQNLFPPKIENYSPIRSYRDLPTTSTPNRGDPMTSFLGPRPSFGKGGVSVGAFYTPVPRARNQLIGDKILPASCSKIVQSTSSDVYSEPQQMKTGFLPQKVDVDVVVGHVSHSTPQNKSSASRSTVGKAANAQQQTLLIQLIKGCYGLGFSITTRDNTLTSRNSSIFIKHILPQGAAVDDGRLQPGDRLLQVNGLDVAQRSHEEVVAYLRGIKLGGKVDLLVTRSTSPSGGLFDGDVASDGQHVTLPDRDVFYFIVDLSGDLGIGMSVRGKTRQSEDGQVTDMGLFIKTIHPEGAAARDGRLRVDDRIAEANGESLVELSNADARETLKDAMQLEGPRPNSICFVIERYAMADSAAATELGVKVQSTPCKKDGHPNAAYLQDTPIKSVALTPSTVKKLCPSKASSSETSSPPTRKPQFQEFDERIISGSNKVDIRPADETVVVRDDPNFTMVSSDPSPNPGEPPQTTANVFSRKAPGRQSMSEKRKGHLDPKNCSTLYNQMKSSRPAAAPGQDLNETQLTLKRAKSDESLVSQINNNNVSAFRQTPQSNAKTCGLVVREALKKYTSVENVKVLGAAQTNKENMKHEVFNKNGGASTKDSNNSGGSDHGKKKLKDIFKSFFKSKPKKENTKPAAATVPQVQPPREEGPPQHRMIDNLLADFRQKDVARSRYDRPISACLDQDYYGDEWTDRQTGLSAHPPPIYPERDYFVQHRHLAQQSSLQNTAFMPIENYSRFYRGGGGGAATPCYCCSFSYNHPSESAQFKREQYYCATDYPHRRSSSRHYYRPNPDHFHGYAVERGYPAPQPPPPTQALSDRYRYNAHDAYYDNRGAMIASRQQQSSRYQSDMVYYDEDDDLNDTVSTIHHF